MWWLGLWFNNYKWQKGYICNYLYWKEFFKYVNIFYPSFSILFKQMIHIFITIYHISPHSIRLFSLYLYFLTRIQLNSLFSFDMQCFIFLIKTMWLYSSESTFLISHWQSQVSNLKLNYIEGNILCMTYHQLNENASGECAITHHNHVII